MAPSVLLALAQRSVETYGMDERMSGMLKTQALCCPDLNLNLSAFAQAWVLFLTCLSLSFLAHKTGMIMAACEVVVRMKGGNVSEVPGHPSVLITTLSSPPTSPAPRPGAA